MSGRTRIIVTAVVMFFVCLLMYFFAVRPQRAKLAEVKENIELAETREVQLQAELDRLQELQANAPALQAELNTIRGFVPVRPELSNFIFQVQQAANSAGLDFVEITPALPAPASEGAALAELSASIGARGGYFALQDFLRRLYSLDRALRVDTLDISVESTEPFGIRLALGMSVRVFHELPEPASTTTTTDVTSEPAPTPTP